VAWRKYGANPLGLSPEGQTMSRFVARRPATRTSGEGRLFCASTISGGSRRRLSRVIHLRQALCAPAAPGGLMRAARNVAEITGLGSPRGDPERDYLDCCRRAPAKHSAFRTFFRLAANDDYGDAGRGPRVRGVADHLNLNISFQLPCEYMTASASVAARQ
jgi:hypothetical protein